MGAETEPLNELLSLPTLTASSKIVFGHSFGSPTHHSVSPSQAAFPETPQRNRRRLVHRASVTRTHPATRT